MLVLKEINPQVNLIEVKEASEQIATLQTVYDLSLDITTNILKVIDDCKHLIFQSEFSISSKDLYKTDDNSFSITGKIIKNNTQEIVYKINKICSEYHIVDNIFVSQNRICLLLYPLKDSFINNVSLPIIRNKIIDKLLNDL